MESSSSNDLNRLRENLEATIAKLQKTLRYWQTWEAEYEGLKEELEAEEKEPSAEEIVLIGTEFGGDVINEKEIKELVNYGKTPRRNRSQVLSVISGRISTGQKNAQLVQRQIDRNQEKLDQTLADTSGPTIKNEDGEPLMEIEEELDEDGNVIAGKVSNFDRTVDQLKEVLQKRDKPSRKLPNQTPPVTSSPDSKPAAPSKERDSKPPPTFHELPIPQDDDESEEAKLALRPAAGNKAGRAPSSRPKEDVTKVQKAPSHPKTSTRAAVLSDQNRVVELDDDDDSILEMNGTSHNVSVATSEAEARRELHRHLQEYSPVVATLNIDGDDDSSWSEGEYTDDDGYEIAENEYGMTNIRSELSDDYLKEMEELLKKHSSVIKNIGPNPDAVQKGILKPEKSVNATQSSKSIPDPESDNNTKTTKKSNGPKTGVRFAEKLNVSPAPPPQKDTIPQSSAKHPSKTSEAPLSDLIVERTPAPKPLPKGNAAPAKISRFKAAKMEVPKDKSPPTATMELPATQPRASTDIRDGAAVSPTFSLDDEFTSYHQRMDAPERKIDRSLFTTPEEVDDEDVDEMPRMSRFKASKLGLEISEHDSY